LHLKEPKLLFWFFFSFILIGFSLAENFIGEVHNFIGDNFILFVKNTDLLAKYTGLLAEFTNLLANWKLSSFFSSSFAIKV